MEFGVPSKRRVATEKHADVAVITLLPFEGENTSRKMEFNKKAYEVMGLTKDDVNEVAFSFNKSNFADNSIIKANGFGIESALNLAKNGKVSNKSHYEEIKKRYGVSMEEELELTIVDSGKEFNGNPVFKLVTLESMKARPRTFTEELQEANDKSIKAEHAALADDTQPETVITDDLGSANAATSLNEEPDDATRAELLEDDYNNQAAPAPVKDSNPWDDVNSDDDLLS